MILFQVYS